MPSAARPQITAQKRQITGRKVKALRRQGIIPANLFGKKIESLSLSLNSLEFKKLYDKTGETGLIDLAITGSKSVRPVLISNVQYHPVTDHFLHVDFHEVDLAEKVVADIPIVITGESPAVKEKGAVLVTVINEIEVSALPADLPDRIQVDISALSEFNDAIHVKDLQFPKKVEVQIEPDAVVVTIQEPKEEKEEIPPAAPDEAETPSEEAADESEKSAENPPAEDKPAESPPVEAKNTEK